MKKRFNILLIISIILSISSCSRGLRHLNEAPVKAVKPPDTLEEQFKKYAKIVMISGLGEGMIRTPEKTVDGTVSVKVKKDELLVKVYSMGILAGKLSSQNNIVKSDLNMDESAKEIIAQGIINGFMWWNLRDYSINKGADPSLFNVTSDMDGKYLTIDINTMLPIEMKLMTKYGDDMYIEYKDIINVRDYSFPKEIIAIFNGYYVKYVFDSIDME